MSQTIAERTNSRPIPTQRAVSPSRRFSGNEFRPDIQGLRAIAVGVVVLFHLWPKIVTGGYIGVDVFFVISGYLITSHLWREAQSTGTIKMRSFYARRALRLLPASVLVLSCTAVASFFLLPDVRWSDTYQQLLASAAYVQNWLLAHNSVDYLLQHAPDSPAQHYWSLSVEEQFYAIWPVLIVATGWLIVRLRRNASTDTRRRAVIFSLSVLLLASLAYSIYDTAIYPKQAYFVTPTRVWEFAVGALCALLVIDARKWFALRAALAWMGIAAIVAASVVFTKQTPFPGSAALLPVLGTAAVILGAQGKSAFSAAWWLSLRPAIEIGDISYAIYLWHWPLLIFVPLVVHDAFTWPIKMAIVAATLVLSWLSTHLFEAPLRANTFLKSRRWPSLAMAIGGVILMLVAALTTSAIFQGRIHAADARFTASVASTGNCLGAAVFDQDNHCSSIFGEGLMMSPALAIKDQGNTQYSDCDTWLDKKEIHSCQFGPANAPVRVAMVGDSHALQWLGAVKALARQGNWHVDTYYKTSCPFLDAVRVLPSEPLEWQHNCTDWQKEVAARLVADTSVQYVIVTAYSHTYHLIPGPEIGWPSMWKKLTNSGKTVVVLRDTPSMLGMSIPECVQRNMDNLYQCAVPREKALLYDPISEIAMAAYDPNIVTIDVNGGICDSSYCYGAAGGLIVYRDTNHLTFQYAETLAPRLWAEFSKAIAPRS